MQSCFKLDPPAGSKLPRFVARAGGCLLASGDDLLTIALRGCRLAYPGSDITVYSGLRIVAVISSGPVDLYTPDELRSAAALRADPSADTVVASQEVG